MAFDNIRLEKGMYRESGKSFSQVLESLDPSEAYKGTALEGTDAFQRQLKRFGIRAKGIGSDTVEKFFSTFESAVLFPEFIARVVRQMRLIVAQHQAAHGKNAGVGVGGAQKLRQPGRLGKGVVVKQRHILAFCQRNALVDGMRKAGVLGIFNQRIARMPLVAAGNGKAFVGGAVVHDDQFKVLLGLPPDALNRIAQPAGAVQVGDNYSCFHVGSF